VKRLIILMALVLGACGGNNTTPAPTTPNNAETTITTGAVTVAQAPPPTENATLPVQTVPEEPALPLTSRGEQIVAMVNGQPITLIEYQRAIDRFEIPDIASYDVIAANELDKLIEQAVINQAAEAMGIEVLAEDVDAEYQAMRDIMPNDADWQQWLISNRFLNDGEFRLATLDALTTAQVQAAVLQDVSTFTIQQVRARHILVSTQDEAFIAYERLQAGEDFASVARDLSIDETTRESGGDLGDEGGWFVASDLIVPELATLALSQPDGVYSQPYPTLLGWHIVQTLERSERPALPEEIATASAQVFAQWLAEQMNAAIIERYVE
jgi:foldase protein PrsA